MTRADKIMECLSQAEFTDRGISLTELTAEVLALMPTAYASIKDVADLTGRTKGTVLSWIQRGQHDCPQPLGTTAGGQVWDRQDWVNWIGLHPGLVRRGQDGVAFGVAIGRTDLV